MCYLNYEGGCEIWKKKYKLFVFDIGGDLDKVCFFRYRRNNFVIRYGVFD